MMKTNSEKWAQYNNFVPGHFSAIESKSSLHHYLERMMTMNARVSESLLTQNLPAQIDFLEQVRIKITRGKLIDARALIQTALKSKSDQLSDSIISELLVELTRIEYQEGNWANSIELTTHLLLNPQLNSATKMKLHQMRTLSFYEIQNWSAALQDINTVKSLETRLPQIQYTFYAEVQSIKILARLEGLPAVEPLVRRLWDQISTYAIAPNLDSVVTLLRLQIDLNRLSGKSYAMQAYICYHLAEAMGDGLYSALAILDLAYSESKGLRKEALAMLPELRVKYKKINTLLTEIETRKPTCELARNLLLPQLRYDDGLSLAKPIDQIILLEPNLFLNLKNLTVESLSLQKRSKEILIALNDGPQTIEDLFLKVWGGKSEKVSTN